MIYTYKPTGVCSRKIIIDIKHGIIEQLEFEGGCDGNLQGIAQLVQGMTVEEVITRCAGIRCGRKDTSCPDQLSLALQEAIIKTKKSEK